MKKKLLVLMLAATITASCVACGNKTSNKENTTTTITNTTESTSVPEDIKIKEQEVKEDSLTPLIDKGIITGVKDITVEENTDIDLNELVYADANIIKSVDIDDSTVDYSKSGVYEVTYTITFDGNNLRDYINENDIDVDFDTEGDTIVVKTTVNITVATKEETEKAIADGDTNVITEDTKESVKSDNKAKANDNAVISKTSSTAGNGSSASGNAGNTGNGNSGNNNTDNGNNDTSNTNNTGNSNNFANNTGNNNPAEPTKANTPTESAHTHNYIEVNRTSATCTTDGITTYQCSCGATKTEKNSSALGHHMVHHDAVTHTEQKLVKEAYDDTVYEDRYVCNGCGAQFNTEIEMGRHLVKNVSGNCNNYYVDEFAVSGGYHDAIYETITVTDSPAYDECDRCGAR